MHDAAGSGRMLTARTIPTLPAASLTFIHPTVQATANSAIAIGQAVIANQPGFFVKPIRSSSAPGLQYLRYDPSSGEILYTSSTTRRRISAINEIGVEEIQAADSARVWDLRPVAYRAMERAEKTDTLFGFVAEDVAEVDPRLVHWEQDDDGNSRVESVDYDQVVTLLLHQTKEIKATYEARIKALEERNTTSEARIKALEEKLDALLN